MGHPAACVVCRYAKEKQNLGVVWKKGSKTRMKKWQKRRVEVHKGVLSYYKKKLFGGEERRGWSSLHYARITRTPPAETDRPFCVDVAVFEPMARTYLFSLSCEADIKAWEEVIMKHVAYCALESRRGHSGAGDP